jgi:hypothetical protein
MDSIIVFLKGLKRGMKNFGSGISLIINSIILGIIYIIVVGLTALIAKLLRKHFLEMKPSSEKETYWDELNLSKKSIEEYYKQF